MKDDKMLNYIKEVLKHASWLVKYNNPSTRHLWWKISKTEFLEQFETLFNDNNWTLAPKWSASLHDYS
jgi:hypothetical protein